MWNTSLRGPLALAALALVLAVRTEAVQNPAGGGSSATNRYGNTAYLRAFPDSRIRGAYDMSFHQEFHYAIPYAAAAVRYAAYRVYQQFGSSPAPMEICDCSTAAGSTPSGRHPGSAHDGGLNFDITYFMQRDVESRIVCPQSADNHCVGPALDLDSDRQAYFFASLAQLDLDAGGKMISLMAVDGKVKEALAPAFERLVASAAFPRPTVQHARDLVYGEATDKGTGWYRFHHNHTHLRFLWRPEEAEQMASSVEAKINRLVPVVAAGQVR
jgi:hypothetical protein